MKNDNFEQSHSAEKSEKSERGDALGFSNIYYVPKYQKIEGGTLWYNQKIFEKKSHSAEKNPS